MLLGRARERLRERRDGPERSLPASAVSGPDDLASDAANGVWRARGLQRIAGRVQRRIFLPRTLSSTEGLLPRALDPIEVSPHFTGRTLARTVSPLRSQLISF